MKAPLFFQSLRVIILGVLLSLGLQSAAQSPHSEVTLNTGINQIGLDYAFLFGETRRHIAEVGVRFGGESSNPTALSANEGYEGFEILYHYVLNSNEKFNFSAGIGYRGVAEDFVGHISIPLSFRYKFDEHFRLRARLTSLLGGAENVNVLPTVGFGVAF